MNDKKSIITTRNILLSPIEMEDGNYLVHSFRAEDLKRLDEIAADVFAILSDEDTLKFLPEKRLYSKEQAEVYLHGSLLSFHAGKNYLHFVSERDTKNIIGMINIISPGLAEQYYVLDEYPFFIEFYLKKHAHKKSIMTKLLPSFIQNVQAQNVNGLAAVINRNNVGARKVLKKSGFALKGNFDLLQDIYVFELN